MKLPESWYTYNCNWSPENTFVISIHRLINLARFLSHLTCTALVAKSTQTWEYYWVKYHFYDLFIHAFNLIDCSCSISYIWLNVCANIEIWTEQINLSEYIMVSQIISIIIAEQHDFREGRSCDTQLNDFGHDLHNALGPWTSKLHCGWF